MSSEFLLYGSTGYVGSYMAQLAVEQGMQPIIAGRNPVTVKAQAEKLGLPYRVFLLEEDDAMDRALNEVELVLHCAGPFHFTSRQMVAGCLRTQTHYLDLTGDIPVLESLFALDAEARKQGVMILPGVGFDVVPTDCLAVYLKQRLPTAEKLTLAFHSDGPALLPPGTLKTAVDMVDYGDKIRSNGELISAPKGQEKRFIDFGQGPVQATPMLWGDLFTAFYSTGIPNINEYAVVSRYLQKQRDLSALIMPLFKFKTVRDFFKRSIKAGSPPEDLARTRTHVWGEVEDRQGNRATARLHGPDAGTVWTSHAALAAVRKVLSGELQPGFQTPGLVFGPDFVLECEGVVREDL